MDSRTFLRKFFHRVSSDDVFDSGSGLVSDHASKNLHKLLTKRSEFDDGDYAAAMKAALADEDGLLLDSFRVETSEPAVSGSTVAACLMNLTKGELVVSNLGDSHVILAERNPQTEHPYHIVSDKNRPSETGPVSATDKHFYSVVSPKPTSPRCLASERASRKPVAPLKCGAGFLGWVSAKGKQLGNQALWKVNKSRRIQGP